MTSHETGLPPQVVAVPPRASPTELSGISGQSAGTAAPKRKKPQKQGMAIVREQFENLKDEDGHPTS
jgi:hypothetical protein